MPYGSKGHSLSKRLPLRPTILDRWAEDNVKTLTVFSTFKYCEQQTPLPLQAMLVQHRSHPRLFSEQHCFKGKGIRIFFENKTKQNKSMEYLFVNRNFMFSLWAIFKTRNGESGNGNGERGIFKSGNL